MRSRILVLLGVLCLLGTVSAFGQEAQDMMAASYPAASSSEMNCSGFIAAQPVSKDIYLFDGADNDNLHYVRAWWPGEHVFLDSRSGASIAEGTVYSMVRPAGDIMRTRWYSGQAASIRSLGKPYVTVGRVKVIRSTPNGAIAEVVSACDAVMRDDIATVAVDRTSPQIPAAGFDRYAPANGKLQGAITAGIDNGAFFGAGRMAYINLGTSDGVAPGQKFRVFHILRVAEEPAGAWMIPSDGPRQIKGRLIVLSTQEKSSVVMITEAIREIRLGDGIELE